MLGWKRCLGLFRDVNKCPVFTHSLFYLRSRSSFWNNSIPNQHTGLSPMKHVSVVLNDISFRTLLESGWFLHGVTIRCTKQLVTTKLIFLYFFFYRRYNPLWVCIHRPLAGFKPPRIRGFLITHNDAPQSVGIPWTSDQYVAKTSTWQHTTITTEKHPCPQWDLNPRSQQASGRRPTH